MFVPCACELGNAHVATLLIALRIQSNIGITFPMSPTLKLTFCLLPCIVVSLTAGAREKCIEITREAWREHPRFMLVYLFALIATHVVVERNINIASMHEKFHIKGPH